MQKAERVWGRADLGPLGINGGKGALGRADWPCLFLGSRLSKVYSQSTLSLSTVANEAPNNLGVKRPTSR